MKIEERESRKMECSFNYQYLHVEDPSITLVHFPDPDTVPPRILDGYKHVVNNIYMSRSYPMGEVVKWAMQGTTFDWALPAGCWEEGPGVWAYPKGSLFGEFVSMDSMWLHFTEAVADSLKEEKSNEG